MAVASSWTLADLAALEAALKTGVSKVTYADRSVEYNSIADMLTLRAEMRAELSDAVPAIVYAGRIS